MPPERAERVAEIIGRALEVEIGQRGALIVDLCGEDRDLLVEVGSLLLFEEKAREFIETPAVEKVAEILTDECRELKAGEVLGDYKILSLIGEGGMGEVYLAEDTKLQRQIAIKLVKQGLGTTSFLRHFRNEEKILAGLNHPNIARLYGGAVTRGGLPYFVMEYVDGPRLDDYCREKCRQSGSDSIQEQLALFRKICAAVTYAHQHLVIHRDIKPANIRVTADGEPKLLDFGIAKLLDPATSTISEQTMTLLGVMTPDYASPEQVRGENMTTASDVYSLGVVLYELLTEQKPYKIDNRTPTNVARAITEQEPARPSTAIAKGAGISKTQIPNLKLLRGDLDNIVMKALRKEPERRYVSVAQFSEDIRRHLDGRPVIARKDTLGYRSAKFVSRHRLGVAAAALIVLSLIGGIVATTWQARATRLEKARTERVNVFLDQMLEYSNPLLKFSRKDGHETTMTQVLDEAAKRVDSGEFSNEPEIKAELEKIIGESYQAQGNRHEAEKHLQKYVDLQRQLHGERHPKTIVALASSAQLLFMKGRFAEAESIYRQVLPVMRDEQKRGNMQTSNLTDALNNFGWLRRTQGDSKEAEALFREALAFSSQMSPEERHYPDGTTRSTLASTLADQGRFDEALQTSREAVAEQRQRGETPDLGFALTILGGFLVEEDDYAEADTNLREGEVILRRFLTPSSLWLGDNLRNQAISLYEQGKYPEALNKATESSNIYRENFGPHYDQYPTVLIIQGLSLAKTGRAKKGETSLREAVKIRTDSLPNEHFWVALAKSALGECLTIEKRFTEAEPLLLSSYESLKNSQGAHNPRTRIALQRLATLYQSWGRPEKANEYQNKFNALR